MKQLSKILAATAAATLAVAPAVAAPANTAALASARAAAPVAKTSKLGGENGGLLIAVAAGLAIIAAIVVVGSEGAKTPESN